MTSLVKRLPLKLNKTKTVAVKAHERVIYSREYYFICKECNRDVSRETFGSRPLYCLQCRPPKSEKKTDLGQKKRPRPVLVQSDNTPQDLVNRAVTV